MEVAEVGIVIPTYGRRDFLHRCVEAVKPQAEKLGGIVIVVDDGTGGGSMREASSADLYLWQPDQGYRLAMARNFGARVAIAAGVSKIVFLDADLLPDANWLEEMMMSLEATSMIFGTVNGVEPNIAAGDPRPWLYALGGNMGVTAYEWIRIGEFDERYNGGWGVEDTDWAYRYCEGGGQIRWIKANATHESHRPRKHWLEEQKVNWEKFVEKFPEDDLGKRPMPKRTDTAASEAVATGEIQTPATAESRALKDEFDFSKSPEAERGVFLVTATKDRPEAVIQWPEERMTWGLPFMFVDDSDEKTDVVVDLLVDREVEGLWSIGLQTGGVGTSAATKQAIEHCIKEGAKYIIELDDHDHLQRGRKDVEWIIQLLESGADYVYGHYTKIYGRRGIKKCHSPEHEPDMLLKTGMRWMGFKAYSVEAYQKAGGYKDHEFPAGDYALALRIEQAGCRMVLADSVWTICPMPATSLSTARAAETSEAVQRYQREVSGC